MSAHLLSIAITVPDDLDQGESHRLTVMIERLGFTPLHDGELPDHGVVRVNDPAVVAVARENRGPDERVLVAVPISVGRTLSEAMARAALEPRFQGEHHPQRSGIFGAFEDVQEQVLALARAGADGLVLDVPLERDVADVLAQIRALVAGAAPRLREASPTERSQVTPTVFYAAGWTPPEGYDQL